MKIGGWNRGSRETFFDFDGLIFSVCFRGLNEMRVEALTFLFSERIKALIDYTLPHRVGLALNFLSTYLRAPVNHPVSNL